MILIFSLIMSLFEAISIIDFFFKFEELFGW